jgi:DNA-binding NtrC family response regulator
MLNNGAVPNRRRFLIVHPDERVAGVLKRALAAEGWDADVVATNEQATELTSNGRYDQIIVRVSPEQPLRRLLEQGLLEQWDLDRLEREYARLVLAHVGGRRGRAAAVLGIDRRTLYRKLKRMGV